MGATIAYYAPVCCEGKDYEGVKNRRTSMRGVGAGADDGDEPIAQLDSCPPRRLRSWSPKTLGPAKLAPAAKIHRPSTAAPVPNLVPINRRAARLATRAATSSGAAAAALAAQMQMRAAEPLTGMAASQSQRRVWSPRMATLFTAPLGGSPRTSFTSNSNSELAAAASRAVAAAADASLHRSDGSCEASEAPESNLDRDASDIALLQDFKHARLTSEDSEPARDLRDLLAEGEHELRSENWPAAERVYSQVLDMDSTLVSAWTNRGRAKLRAGDLAGAMSDYTEAVRLDPANTAAQSELSEAKLRVFLAPLDGPTLCERGIAKADRGDFDGAVVDFALAVRLGYPGAQEQLAKVKDRARGASP